MDAVYITTIFCLSTCAEGARILLFFYFFLAPWETNGLGGRWTAGASGFLSWSVGKKDARPGQGRMDGPATVVTFGPKHYYTWAIHSLRACGSSWAHGRSIGHRHGCSTAASNALVVSSTVADAGERVHSRDEAQMSNCRNDSLKLAPVTFAMWCVCSVLSFWRWRLCNSASDTLVQQWKGLRLLRRRPWSSPYNAFPSPPPLFPDGLCCCSS